MMSLLLTSLAVVRDREIGTLEQLMGEPAHTGRADRRRRCPRRSSRWWTWRW